MIFLNRHLIIGLIWSGALAGCGTTQPSETLQAKSTEIRQIWTEVVGYSDGQADSLYAAKSEAQYGAEISALKRCRDVMLLKGCQLIEGRSRFLSAMEVPAGSNGFRTFTQHRVSWEAYAKGYKERWVTENETPDEGEVDSERWRRVLGSSKERRSSLEEANRAAKTEAERNALRNCRNRDRLMHCRLVEGSSRSTNTFHLPYGDNGFTTTYVYDVFWEAYAEGQR